MPRLSLLFLANANIFKLQAVCDKLCRRRSQVRFEKRGGLIDEATEATDQDGYTNTNDAKNTERTYEYWNTERAQFMSTGLEWKYVMNMYITDLQEIRWSEVGLTNVGNVVLFCSGNDQNAHAFGTGFELKKSLLNSVLRFEPLGDRMIGTFYNYSLISVHASTEDKDEGIKDLFDDLLEILLAQLPKQNMTLILGDFNAKIGQEKALRTDVGMQNLHNASDGNGRTVADLEASNNMIIKSTMFDRLRWRDNIASDLRKTITEVL
ncbi:hypothetical protein HUJ05_003275 [Dendroctonus ponderosae]|nr:hypothetical protein HUJ05_003275 [Dendroctonus ponderosae]